MHRYIYKTKFQTLRNEAENLPVDLKRIETFEEFINTPFTENEGGYYELKPEEQLGYEIGKYDLYIINPDLEPVVLDTETTGLGHTAEIVEIAIIGANSGKIYLNTLIKPTVHIPADASKIHGITDEMVKDAPMWADIYPQFMDIINQRYVHIYNARFDNTMILISCKKSGLTLPKLRIKCVMLKYAELYDDYHDYFKDYTWQKLTDAMRQQNIDVSNLTAHRALADCQMTRLLMQKIDSGTVTTIDGYTQEQRKIKDVEMKKAQLEWEAQEAERRKKKREEGLARRAKYRKSTAKKSALIPKNWSEFPYFGMSRPKGYKTFSKLRIKELHDYEYAGTCCSTYGDQGHLFKPKTKTKEVK